MSSSDAQPHDHIYAQSAELRAALYKFVVIFYSTPDKAISSVKLAQIIVPL